MATALRPSSAHRPVRNILMIVASPLSYTTAYIRRASRSTKSRDRRCHRAQ
jgi:hypothetical protein